jgi:hypothetical protein
MDVAVRIVELRAHPQREHPQQHLRRRDRRRLPGMRNQRPPRPSGSGATTSSQVGTRSEARTAAV